MLNIGKCVHDEIKKKTHSVFLPFHSFLWNLYWKYCYKWVSVILHLTWICGIKIVVCWVHAFLFKFMACFLSQLSNVRQIFFLVTNESRKPKDDVPRRIIVKRGIWNLCLLTKFEHECVFMDSIENGRKSNQRCVLCSCTCIGWWWSGQISVGIGIGICYLYLFMYSTE